MQKSAPLLNSLIGYGMTMHEARVYLACLSTGPTTVIKLSEASGLKRTTIYSVLDSLIKRGLVSIEAKGLKQLYVAEPPAKLDALFDSRREEFRRKLPEFEALYNLKGGESVIKYYEGVEGMKSVYNSLLSELRPKDEYLVLASQENWLSLDKEFFEAYRQQRRKLNLRTRMILEDTPEARKVKNLEQAFKIKVKLVLSPIGHKSNLVILPGKVVIPQIVSPVMTLVVANPNIVDLHRNIFNLIWRSLPE